MRELDTPEPTVDEENFIALERKSQEEKYSLAGIETENFLVTNNLQETLMPFVSEYL